MSTIAKPQTNIYDIRWATINNHPYLAPTILLLEPISRTLPKPLMVTDDYRLLYDPKKIAALDERERTRAIVTLAVEVVALLQDHPLRAQALIQNTEPTKADLHDLAIASLTMATLSLYENDSNVYPHGIEKRGLHALRLLCNVMKLRNFEQLYQYLRSNRQMEGGGSMAGDEGQPKVRGEASGLAASSIFDEMNNDDWEELVDNAKPVDGQSTKEGNDHGSLHSGRYLPPVNSFMGVSYGFGDKAQEARTHSEPEVIPSSIDGQRKEFEGPRREPTLAQMAMRRRATTQVAENITKLVDQHGVKTYGSTPGTKLIQWALEYLSTPETAEQILNKLIMDYAIYEPGGDEDRYDNRNRRQHFIRRTTGHKILMSDPWGPTASISVLVDTSGSMDMEQVELGASCVLNAVHRFGISQPVHLFHGDTRVHSTELTHPSELAKAMCKLSHGGTNMGRCINTIAEHYPETNLLMVVTDADTPWSDEPPFPVVVLLTDGPRMVPEWAKSVDLQRATIGGM